MQSQPRVGAGRDSRRMRPSGIALLGLVGVTLSACGAAGASTSEPNGARLASLIALNGTLVLTSPFPLNASFTDDISTAATTGGTCAEATQGFLQDGVRYEPPHNPQGVTFNTLDGRHHAVTITMHVGGYNGPATYGKANVFANDGLQLMRVDGYSYGTFLGGDVAVKVAPDDSGQVTFTNLTLIPPTPLAPAATSGTPPPPTPKPTPLPAAPPLTGQLTWTCVQVRAPTPTAVPTPSSGLTVTAPPPAPTAAPAPTPTPKH